LPTLEEVKAEASRVTMERIKVGMRVLLHPNPTKQKSDVQDSIIPKYAVSAMLKTFGLVGEVLDIDKVFFMPHTLLCNSGFLIVQGFVSDA